MRRGSHAASVRPYRRSGEAKRGRTDTKKTTKDTIEESSKRFIVFCLRQHGSQKWKDTDKWRPLPHPTPTQNHTRLSNQVKSK